MPKFPEAYGDNYIELTKFFGEKNFFTAKEVGEFIGRDYRTAQKLYQIPKEGITKATLARRMSK